MAKSEGLTPMMQKFWEMKSQNPDAILLYRVGDFYETYGSDAITASSILGITLTHRSNGGVVDTEMAGFPHHALDTYLPRLVRAGKRVAICDQLEDPKLAKGLVKRGLTELVTPGVSYSDTVLDFKENNFLAAIHFGKIDKEDGAGVAFLDISTGEFLTAQGSYDYVDKLLSSMQPKEVVYERTKRNLYAETFGTRYCTFEMDDWVFTNECAHDRLLKQFETANLKGFGIEDMTLSVVACGAIFCYLDQTMHNKVAHITHIARIDGDNYVWLDQFTTRNLELFGAMYKGGKSLADTLDMTVCPMGARMLRRWVSFPLKDVRPIRQRLDIVETLYSNDQLSAQIEENLRALGDLERTASKVSVGRVSAREMVALKIALMALNPIKDACQESDCEGLKKLADKINPCDSVSQKIANTLVADPPGPNTKVGLIATGVNTELDELREISHNSKGYLMEIQQRESVNTGIPSLKIAYNNVFGYYIEVRNTHKDKVPSTWIRKQTLANAERYITEELKEYEEKILGAEGRIESLEDTIFRDLIAEVAEYVPMLQTDAVMAGQLDTMLSFAKVAKAYNYVKPEVNDSEIIDIKQGRHPVIERQLPVGQEYIANDLTLDSNDQQIMMITGPNMAGKSALLRQTALIVLMAQMGCYVPAKAASIGVVDKVFTRVGASDNISMGESTFMVEMNEAASIINNLSHRSLVLFDELGRGTSTYDGISIAWAIVEYIHENPNAHAKTLFATHYHELNEMEKTYPRIRNYNVSVKEVNNKIIFLRKLAAGGSEHSFGIHVAKIAGLPKNVVDRANDVLKQLEAAAKDSEFSADKPQTQNINAGMQLSLFQLDDPVLSQIRDEIIGLDINNLTPMQALQKLNDIKHILTGRND